MSKAELFFFFSSILRHGSTISTIYYLLSTQSRPENNEEINNQLVEHM